MSSHMLNPSLQAWEETVRSLQRRWWWLATVRGAGTVALYAGAFLAVTLALDWSLRLDRGQRLVMLLAGCGGLGWVMYRRWWRPWRQPVSGAQWCQRIEAAHPQLAGRLSAAVELSDPDTVARQWASHRLAARQVAAGLQLLSGLDLWAVFRPKYRAQVRGMAVLGLVTLLALTSVWAWPAGRAVLHLWGRRVLALENVPWPTRTQLQVVGLSQGDLVLPRGDDWELTVRAHGKRPAAVYARLEPQRLPGAEDAAETGGITEASGGVEELTAQDVAAVTSDVATYRLVVRNVLAPLRVRVWGGDDQSDWFAVRLVERPQARQVLLRVQPPAYTQLPAATMSAGVSTFAISAGSQVMVLTQPARPIATATLQREGAESLPLTRLASAPEFVVADPTMMEAPTSAAGVPGGGGGGWWGVTLSPGQLTAGRWTLGMTDADGWAARPGTTLTVKVVPDRAPTVRSELQGIGSLVTARALVPVSWRTEDDYGVAQVVVHTTTHSAAGVTEAGAGADQPGAAGALPDQAAAQWDPPKPQGQGVTTLDLATAGLAAGMGLTLEVRAWDCDDMHGPHLGTAAPIFLRVVEERELRADLLRREQEQRQELEHARQDQEDWQSETRALAAALGDEPWSAPRQQDMAALLRRQRGLTERASAITHQFAMLRAETIHNRLEEENGPVIRRLDEQVVGPLQNVSRQQLPAVVEALETARQAQSPSQRQAALAQAAQRQAQVAETWRQVLHAMARWENYQEAVNLLQDVVRLQDDVHQATEKEAKQRVRAIFDEP